MSSKNPGRNPRRNSQGIIGASLAGALAFAPTGIATAQEGLPDDGGLTFDATIGQTIEASDNPDLDDPAEGRVAAITSLTGALASVTRSRALQLEFSTALELDDDGFVLDSGSVDLTYLLATETSEFEVFAGFAQSDASTEELVDLGGVGDLDLEVLSGTRNTVRYGARLLLGNGTPLTFSLRGERSETTFDSEDPDATDSQSLTLNSTLSFALDEATELRVIGSYSDVEEDDGLDSSDTTTTAGLGLTRSLGNATTVSVEVDWQEIRSEPGADVTSGVGGRLAFDREMPNGSVGLSASRAFTVDGTIDEFRFSRALEFPASELSLEAGAVLTNSDTLSPLLGLSYERRAPDGVLIVGLVQDAGINGDDETVLNTIGQASYTRSVNALSSYTAAVSVSNQSVIGADDTTRTIDGSLTYSRALTDDVSLSLGYEHERRFETGEDEVTANTVFVTLSRTFSVRR